MHKTLLLTAVGITATLASPVAFPQGTGAGADSCPSDDLTAKTWTDLNIDGVLADAAGNYTKTTTNNIQSLADFFGAPNFFCGLDNFCNAGQPCLPVQVPAWYSVVAIQNWNNYMNSLNTAVGFATSILSLKLPEIVQDIYPDPKDDVTSLKTAFQIVSGVISVVPFTGAVSTAASAVSSGLGFINGRLQPPAPTDRFLAWSDIAGTMSDVLRDYQSAISGAITKTLNAPIDDPDNGINGILKDGTFLGISQNFTQKDVQDAVIDSITISALGFALQAQKAFVTRFFNQERCTESENTLCIQNDGSDTFTGWSLLKRGDRSNARSLIDQAKVLTDKYGLTKLEFLKGPTNCYDNNGKQQLTNRAFEQGLPLDPKAECVFNLLVCDIDSSGPATGRKGIVDFCKEDRGLDI